MKNSPFQRMWEKATFPGRGAARKRREKLSLAANPMTCFQGEAKTELMVHAPLSDIKQTSPALCYCWRSLSVSYHATIVITLLSPTLSVPCQQWDGPRGKKSIHELLILAHSVPLARTQTHIPALLTVPGCALKGSTQQVMGCGQEGMQITTVPFQLWALKGGIQCLPDPAPGHSLCLCSCSTGQMLPICIGQGAAGHLYLASWAQGQDSSVQVMQEGLPAPLHYCLYKKMQIQEQTPFYARTHMSKEA